MDNKIAKLQQARLRAREKGFTLVELAIVLVIIGLIIGGVLVGQDLIKAAEIRAQITQIEQYNAAVNTFRTRFNSLPGDARNITSFFNATTYPDIRNGNGNRQLEWASAGVTAGLVAANGTGVVYSSVDTGTPDHVGEVLQFWHHLSAAELVGGSFNGTGGTGAAQLGTLGFSFPNAKLDRNGIGAFASGGKNYYQIGVVSGATYTIAPSLTPEEAFNLDSKIDDGRPGSGSVVLRGSQAASRVNAPLVVADWLAAGGTKATACIEEDASTAPLLRASTYAIASTGIVCSIRLRMN